MWLWPVDARAATNFCFLADVVETFPRDQDVGVPRTVRPTLVVDPREEAGCFDAEVVTLRPLAGGREVAIDVVTTAGVVEVAPLAPLTPGEWMLEANLRFHRFTVEDPPRELVDAPPAEASLELVRHCEEALAWTELKLHATWPDPPPPGESLLLGFLRSDDGGERPIGAELYRGRTVRTTFVEEVLGDVDACGWFEARDWEGRVLWTTDEVCASEPPCRLEAPTRTPEEPEGGCDTGGSGPWLWVPVVALLARRRVMTRIGGPESGVDG